MKILENEFFELKKYHNFFKKKFDFPKFFHNIAASYTKDTALYIFLDSSAVEQPAVNR